MQSRALLLLSAAILMAGSLCCARGQAVVAGYERRQMPLSVGIGMSNFDLDYGKDSGGERRMNGLTASLDTDIPRASGLLKGFGLEIEGRDLNYLRPSTLAVMRQSTILGGSTYTWPYSRTVRPLAKYLVGMGSIHFPNPRDPKYTHDTRMVLAPGIGLECRLFGTLSVRGDYEYQFWRRIFGPHSLTPNGFTVTTVYDFRSSHQNRF